MVNWFKGLILAGFDPADSFHERRKVKTSNVLLLFLLFINLINLAVFVFDYGTKILIWDSVLNIIFCIIGIGLQKAGYRSVVRHSVILFLLASMGNLLVQYGNVTGVHFFMMYFFFIPFILFDKPVYVLSYVSIIFIMYFIYELHFDQNPLQYDPKLHSSYYPNLTLALLIYFYVVYHFKSELLGYQKVVEDQNKNLTSLTVKMMHQKDEVLLASHQLRKKTDELEQQTKSIFESLRLASLVQREALPSEEVVFSGLKGGFLLYLPKDVVSGDFYWARQTFEGQLIVVADCIGHGVPGGMMAVFAANLISQIVEEQGKIFPSDILAELDKKLRRRLRQEIHTDLADGMDIAVLLVGAHTISFASAGRPLIKIEAGKEPVEIKGTRQQLASWHGRIPEFETVEVPIKRGDRFYIYTDGFADQLSGEHNRRLTNKRLRQELMEIQALPMSKQKAELESLIVSWQGAGSQTDDILMIGFEV